MQLPAGYSLNNSAINLFSKNPDKWYREYIQKDTSNRFTSPALRFGTACHEYIGEGIVREGLSRDDMRILNEVIEEHELELYNHEVLISRRMPKELSGVRGGRKSLRAHGTLDGLSKDKSILLEIKTSQSQDILYKRDIDNQIYYYMFLERKIRKCRKLWLGTTLNEKGEKCLTGDNLMLEVEYNEDNRKMMYETVSLRIERFIRQVEQYEPPTLN